MTRYMMDDGTIVDTGKAAQTWSEQTRFDGSNHVSVNTGSQWIHEALHRSSKGRYYLETWSQYQGSTPSAEWMDPEAAARWLLLNDEPLPEDLAHLESEVAE